MGRRKSKLSTLSIFRWFCKNVAIAFGITAQSGRNRRILTKRRNRKVNATFSNKSITTHTNRKINSKINAEFNNVCRLSGASESRLLNNNNNRSLDHLAYGDINVNRLSDVHQQRIICILVENPKIADCIQHLGAKHASIFRNSRIIDLQDLVQVIQSSTMTNNDQMIHQTTLCSSFIPQSENVRRFKALKFIRMFIEKNKEDFFEYLINEEHLCQQKTLAIYQMIKQFLKVVYQPELVQNKRHGRRN